MITKLDIDISPWLTHSGVSTSLWIGRAAEPVHEETTSYEELIDQTLESYTVRGVILETVSEEAEEFVKALEAAATYARTRLEEMSE